MTLRTQLILTAAVVALVVLAGGCRSLPQAACDGDHAVFVHPRTGPAWNQPPCVRYVMINVRTARSSEGSFDIPLPGKATTDTNGKISTWWPSSKLVVSPNRTWALLFGSSREAPEPLGRNHLFLYTLDPDAAVAELVATRSYQEIFGGTGIPPATANSKHLRYPRASVSDNGAVVLEMLDLSREAAAGWMTKEPGVVVKLELTTGLRAITKATHRPESREEVSTRYSSRWVPGPASEALAAWMQLEPDPGELPVDHWSVQQVLLSESENALLLLVNPPSSGFLLLGMLASKPPPTLRELRVYLAPVGEKVYMRVRGFK